MNNVIKNILVIMMTIVCMFSAIVIHIYNTTSIDSSVGNDIPLTKEEIIFYDMFVYTLCISGIIFLILWCYKQLKNPHLF